jgi:hypothetical protein
MAIISDGSTDITIEFVDEEINPNLEKSEKRTAGGNARSITGGERLILDLKLRLTPSQVRSITNLFKNNANNYYYTPEDSTADYWSELYPSLSFPYNATFSKLVRDWDNRSKWYYKMVVTSTEYV